MSQLHTYCQYFAAAPLNWQYIEQLLPVLRKGFICPAYLKRYLDLDTVVLGWFSLATAIHHLIYRLEWALHYKMCPAYKTKILYYTIKFKLSLNEFHIHINTELFITQ